MEKQAVISLSTLKFSAKLDYVTLDGVVRKDLGSVSGSLVWPRSFNGRRLTLHDPSRGDLEIARQAFPCASLAEIEVAVDVRPSSEMSQDEHGAVLSAIKAEYLGKRLRPSVGIGLGSGFRGSYKRTSSGYLLRPFNMRVPECDEQHLYGTRYDGVQVKVYFKKRDNGQSLPWTEHVVRAEVRLGPAGLVHHGLLRVEDLFGFAFRKQLSPYFRTVRGVTRVASADPHTSPMLQVLNEKSRAIDAQYWASVGVGAFEHGGRRHGSPVRFLRDQALNDRVGQALHRLQSQYAPTKFVCAAGAANDETLDFMRPAA